MERSSVFKSNKSQAIRLPKPVALPESVKQSGYCGHRPCAVDCPAGEAWDSWFASEGLRRILWPNGSSPLSRNEKRSEGIVLKASF